MFAGDPSGLGRRYTKGIQQIPLTSEALHTPLVAMVNSAAIGAIVIWPVVASSEWDAGLPGLEKPMPKWP